MTVINNRTPNLSLALPHQDNELKDDVARLREALGSLDTIVFGKATPADITAAIAALLNGAPAALDTLKELADAIADDANFAATMTTALAGKAALVHTHAMSDITGLVAALAAKLSAVPIATPSVLGGVKVGAGLAVAGDGTLSTTSIATQSYTEQSVTPGSNGQTLFTVSGGYTPGLFDVFVNGVKLYGNGDDYTATNGTTVTLTTGVNTTDTLQFRIWAVFNVANALLLAGGSMSGALNEAQGADVASASTVNLTTATGNKLNLTGNATINTITLAAGAERTLILTGSPTFTHSSTLVCPGLANIVGAAGDKLTVVGFTGGITQIVSYTRASGRPVIYDVAGSMVLLTPNGIVASGAASVDLENYYDSTYDHYVVLGCNVTHATDSTDLYLQFKIAGSYVTASYQSHIHASSSVSTTYTGFASPGSAIKMADAVSNNAAAANSFRVELDFPAETAKWKKVQFTGVSTAGGGSNQTKLMNGGGNYIGGTGALTGLRFKASSGNISGTFYVFGVKKA